jgi:hypothetical protein
VVLTPATATFGSPLSTPKVASNRRSVVWPMSPLAQVTPAPVPAPAPVVAPVLAQATPAPQSILRRAVGYGKDRLGGAFRKMVSKR